MNTIGDKIRNARLNKKMTQEELGQKLGVQKSAIAKWENGKVVNIKRSNLKMLSVILDIPAHELISEDWEKPIEEHADFHAMILKDAKLMEALKVYYSLDANTQTIVLNFINGLVATK